jgi:hypothetical protein
MVQKEMEHTYVALEGAIGTEAVIDGAGTVVIFGFHNKRHIAAILVQHAVEVNRTPSPFSVQMRKSVSDF